MHYNERTGEWEDADVGRRQNQMRPLRMRPLRNTSANIDWNRVREIALELDERASQQTYFGQGTK